MESYITRRTLWLTALKLAAARFQKFNYASYNPTSNLFLSSKKKNGHRPRKKMITQQIMKSSTFIVYNPHLEEQAEQIFCPFWQVWTQASIPSLQ